MPPSCRSLLFLPASNPRAVAKAGTLAADALILDLEDAVKDGDKAAARDGAEAALAAGFGDRVTALRINGVESGDHGADLALAATVAADFVVLPKVETAEAAAAVARAAAKPVWAMIETPAAVLAAPSIAAAAGVAGLIVGANDLAAALRLSDDPARQGLSLPLQMVVLAARAADIAAYDSVFNGLDDPQGFAAECAVGRRLGFDGKAVIHPNQIEAANRAFSPTMGELEDAAALVAAATGGAERFRGRMIEAMHVATARRLLSQAGKS